MKVLFPDPVIPIIAISLSPGLGLKPENTSPIVSAVSLDIMQSCVGIKKEVSTSKLGRL